MAILFWMGVAAVALLDGGVRSVITLFATIAGALAIGYGTRWTLSAADAAEHWRLQRQLHKLLARRDLTVSEKRARLRQIEAKAERLARRIARRNKTAKAVAIIGIVLTILYGPIVAFLYFPAIFAGRQLPLHDIVRDSTLETVKAGYRRGLRLCREGARG